MNRSDFFYIQLPSDLVGMFRFLLEAYENLAFATTLDPHTALLKISFARENRAEVNAAFCAIEKTIPIQRIPDNWRVL